MPSTLARHPPNPRYHGNNATQATYATTPSTLVRNPRWQEQYAISQARRN